MRIDKLDLSVSPANIMEQITFLLRSGLFNQEVAKALDNARAIVSAYDRAESEEEYDAERNDSGTPENT